MLNKKTSIQQYSSESYSLLIKTEYTVKNLKRLTGIISILITVSCIAFADTAPKDVNIKLAEKKQLNTFFSNFSEAFVEPFEKDALSDAALIQFCITHNYINNYSFFVKAGGEYQMKIKASYINSSAVKFFGRKVVKHQSVGSIEYKNGWYYTTDASGEAFSFSQIATLYDNGNNIYTATVNVYTAGSGWAGNVHGDNAEWKKFSPDDLPELSEVMKSTLQKIKDKGNSRYILIDYLKVK